MPVLIVVSHPDDEVLGCGGMATALSAHGVPVRSCILASGADARTLRPETDELMENLEAAHILIGARTQSLGTFPNIAMNTVPHLKVVQFIEDAIVGSGADRIFTHHPMDLNDDHRHTSLACQAAARLFQRRADVPRLKGLYFMEILSSTDWAFGGAGAGFHADTFFEIGERHLETKIAALAAYKNVMRNFPHPRSAEIVRALAAYRGGQAGMRYAEAFQTAFRAVDETEFHA